jgi:hypothetical protein
MRIRLLPLLVLLSGLSAGPVWQIITSTPDRLQLEIQTDVYSPDDLKPVSLLIGLPGDDYPDLQLETGTAEPCPVDCPDSDPAVTMWIGKQRLRDLWVATLQISPLAGDGSYHPQMVVTVTFPDFPDRNRRRATADQTRFLSHRIVNWNVARHWFQPRMKSRKKTAVPPPGDWIRFTVTEDGIYAITGADLLALSSVIANRDPRSFMLFTGTSLGRDATLAYLQRFSSTLNDIYAPLPENLTEVAVAFEGEENGQLDPDDRLIFYGRGASGFDQDGTEVTYHQNLYFTANTYWLLLPADQTLRGKRVVTATGTVTNPVTLDYGLAYVQVETDLQNPFQSGLAWVGPAIRKGAIQNVFISLPAPDPTVTATLTFGLYGGSANLEVLDYPYNEVLIYYQSTGSAPLGSLSWQGLGSRKITITLPGNFLADGNNLFLLKNNGTSQYAQPYFDYLTARYGRRLEFNGEPLEFFSPVHGNPIKFEIDATAAFTAWDITNPAWPVQIPVLQEGTTQTISLEVPADTLRRLLLYSPAAIPGPTALELMGTVDFQELRNSTLQADHLVVAPEEYRSALQPLIAHRSRSRFVPLESIYREFTGGNPDPIAIHHFLQWALENWNDPPPLYLLLVGDADYDYRNITGQSRIKVPTIEAGFTSSHATDDRLATIYGKIPEISLGRFPARSVAEVEAFVEKLLAFETEPELGLWRQRITLVADDAARPENELHEIGTGKSHTQYSEIIANLTAPTVQIQKLYMMEFPEVSDASTYGVVKPDATAALLNYLREGTALVNYIGHGSANQWAQERLLVQARDLNLIDTGMRLPVWIAGTCSWGHFDDFNNESFAEDLIRQPLNGASAIITTTRPITVYSNQYYEEQLFRALFPNRTVTAEPVGIVLQSVKTGNISGEYFHLFGDPAMPLPIPANLAQLTELDPDTLRTLDAARFAGTQDLEPAGGAGFVILRDADRPITREYNFLSTVQQLSYTLPGAVLFRGQFTFTGARFEGSLRVPKDITYSDLPGRLNVYLTLNSDNPQEALGVLEPVYLIGGNPVQDHQGPLISFLTDQGRLLRSGDHLRGDETLVIQLSDPLGINLTREVGHEILLTDVRTGQSRDVTNRFIYEPNSITTGTIRLEPTPGKKTIHLTVKAWDNGNNPAEAEIRLSRSESADLKLFRVLNYPNPFRNTTQFTFELTAPAEVSIDIYTLGGRRIHTIEKRSFPTGYHTIDWDGRDAFGDPIANGVYLYRVKARNESKTVTTIGRLARFR